MRAPYPPNEAERLRALLAYEVLDTPPEPEFDDLTHLAVLVCQVPTAVVTLIDENRQWFKSRESLDVPETHRDLAFCAHSILSEELMVVEDTLQDERFVDNALVTGTPYIRFYAGAPLVVPGGYAVGTLAVIDYRPRQLTQDQREALRALARQVVAQLELRRQLVTERRQASEELSRDVRQRREAEEALHLSESRYRRLVEANVIGVVVAGLDGRIVEANDHFLAMVGASRSDVRSGLLSWGASTPEEWGSRDRACLAELRHTGRCGAYEKELFHRDGRRVPALVASALLEGAPRDCMWVVADLSERKRAEAERRKLETQFRHAQKMEAVGQLAGGVAHDFNNILAAILGNVELARADVGPHHPARVSLDEIVKAGQRAKQLVQQILAFSRNEQPAFHPIELRTVVTDIVGMLRASLPLGVELRVGCADGVPRVLADETQVHRALVNLCTNSWQALEGEPGRIEIRLDAVEVDAELANRHADLHPGRYARVSVTDTGKGMDTTTRERLFEPFFTTKPRGTGLGLPVVHGIVRTHGGAVLVSSKPGEGATFELYLPACEGTCVTPLPAVKGDSAPRGRGERVLYLDDEESLVFLVTRTLGRLGYRVTGFTRPEEALAAVRADPEAFDLVVTDHNMPGASGLQVAAEVKRLHPQLPVAMASGYVTDELRERAARVGVRELIYKPNTVDELCEAIHRLTAKVPVPA